MLSALGWGCDVGGCFTFLQPELLGDDGLSAEICLIIAKWWKAQGEGFVEGSRLPGNIP